MSCLLPSRSRISVYGQAIGLLRHMVFSTSELKAPAAEVPEQLSREEYNRRYAAYQKELRSFRVKTREEFALKEAEEERLTAAKNEVLNAEQKAKAKAERKEKKRIAKERKREMKRQLQISTQRKEAAFRREVKRRELLAKAEDDRYAELLQQSRAWITAETLDDRIESALDNSTTLY